MHAVTDDSDVVLGNDRRDQPVQDRLAQSPLGGVLPPGQHAYLHFLHGSGEGTVLVDSVIRRLLQLVSPAVCPDDRRRSAWVLPAVIPAPTLHMCLYVPLLQPLS